MTESAMCLINNNLNDSPPFQKGGTGYTDDWRTQLIKNSDESIRVRECRMLIGVEENFLQNSV